MSSRAIGLRFSVRMVWLLLLFYSAGILYLLFFSPSMGRVLMTRSPNWIPLRTIISLFRFEKGLDYSILNILGNWALLLPLGVFGSWLFPPKKKRILLPLLFGVVISFFLEGLQWISRLGYFDVDDLWLNAWGFAVGVYWGTRSLVRSKERRAP